MKRTVLTAGMILLMGLAAQAQTQTQWVQTNGPQGAQVMKVVTDGSVVMAKIAHDIYLYEDGKWTKKSSLKEFSNGTNYANGLTIKDDVVLASARSGVVRSTDFGATWSRTGVAGVTFSDGDLFYVYNFDSLYRSSDGKSWTGNKVTENFGMPVFFKGAMYMAGGYTPVITRSTDGGATWTQVQHNLQDISMGAQLWAGDDAIYASGQGYIYRSTDGANFENITYNLTEWVTFTEVISNGTEVVANTNYGLQQFRGAGWFPINAPFAMDLEPAKGAVFAATDAGIFKINDGTTRLVSMNEGLIGHGVWALGSVGNAVIASTSNGLYRSIDGGDSWDYVETIKPMSFLTRNGSIFAPNGIMKRSDDQGATWQISGPRYPFELEDMDNHMGDIAGLDANSKFIFVGVSTFNTSEGANSWSNGGVYRSSDNGNTWAPASDGIPIDCFTWAPTSSVLATDDYVLAATAAGIYRSTNNGDYWYVSDNGIPFDTRYNAAARLFKLKDRVYAYTRYGYFMSADGGQSWQTMKPAPPEGYEINYVMSYIGDKIWVQGYKTTQVNDSTWNHETVVFSFDGNTWEDITSTVPPDHHSSSFVVNGGFLYAGTGDAGVWKMRSSEGVPQSAVRGEESESGLKLAGYPNPTKGATTVEVSLARRGHATISLLNTLGEEVALIHDGTLEAGQHSRSIEMNGLPAGAYLLRMTVDGVSTQSTLVKLQ